MKISAVVLTSFLPILIALTSLGCATTATTQELLRRETEWTEATRTHDFAALDQILGGWH